MGLRAAFEEFNSANPYVWHLFERFTFETMAAGHAHYSSDAILHRIRWHVRVETRSSDGFKINNNHSPYFARKFEEVYPQHCGFFRNRRVNGDESES